MDPFSMYPTRVRAGSSPDAPVYAMLPGYFVVHGTVPPEWTGTVVQLFGNENITVCRGAVPESAATTGDLQLSPAYSQGPGAPPSAPTGLLFVRFGEGDLAAEHRGELESAGFTIDDLPGYAPHAAWVRPVSGNLADALAGLERLRSMPGVANVEPQFVTRAARRGPMRGF